MLSITSSYASAKSIMTHKHNHHIKRDTRMYVILIFTYGNGRLQYSRLQSITIDENTTKSHKKTHSSFLIPTKKGLRIPILKCNIPLAIFMPLFYCHQSVAQPSLFINLFSSTSACKYSHQNYCSISSHQYC